MAVSTIKGLVQIMEIGALQRLISTLIIGQDWKFQVASQSAWMGLSFGTLQVKIQWRVYAPEAEKGQKMGSKK